MFRYPYQKSLSLMLLAALAGCGGGSGGSGSGSGGNAGSPNPSSVPDTSTTYPAAPLPAPTTASMTMSCVDGPTYQCSGPSIIRSDNGVALTSSGVQVYGKSTNDLAVPIVNDTTAYGLTLASGGIAELRLDKAGNGGIPAAAVLLNNLGISLDSVNERPQIIEIFRTTQGRVQLDSRGAITFGVLPDSSNLGYYDFATKGAAATQANYVNNQYFPRSTPSRCSVSMMPCPTLETTGIHYTAGDWRTGGRIPDLATATREHGDGDIHAGNGIPDASGNPTFLAGSTAAGVPYPGTKGTRDLINWGFQYGNLGAWKTKDTVRIDNWGATNEHNQNRRGLVAFGNVTDLASIPTADTASYSGFVYGWYARNTTEDAAFFRGEALVTVNFATRQVIVKIQNTMADFDLSEQFATSAPIALTAVTAMGAAGTSVANYLTGSADNGALKGGLSGRYFGPVITTGTSGAGPAEIGGTFSLSNSTTGQAVVGGFIGRKQ